jgi:hypothetical protein
MGLFDGYVDPEQFRDSGGLLGRLLSLQQLQGQYQPGAGFDQAPSVPRTPVLQLAPWPNLPGYGPSSGEPTAAPNPTSQYQALRPVLGDHNAMLATVSPEIGKTLIAQALANQQSGNTPNVVLAGYGGRAIPFPPMRPGPLPPIPVPAIPDFWKAAGPFLQLYPGILSGPLGGAALTGAGATILNNEDPGDKPSSTPIGRRGNPIEVKPGTNRPTTIGGRIYTGHAADQMQGRGITPSAVEETIRNGQPSPGRNSGETEHIGTNGVKVVTGADGQVITVITVRR